MSAYFGNGYLLNILQRGAMPVGNAPANPTPAPVQLEETVATTGNQSEVSSQTFAVQSESLEHPVNASTANHPPQSQIETASLEAPQAIEVMTRFESREVPSGTTTRQAPDTQDQEAKASLWSNDSHAASEPALPALFQVASSLPTEHSVHTEPLVEHPPEIEHLPARQATSSVFELRMPENFFRDAQGETSATAQLKPVIVSAALDTPTEKQSTVDHVSEVVVPAKTQADAPSHVNTVIIPKHRDAAIELQPRELNPPGAIVESQLRPENVVSEVMDQVQLNMAQPPRLVPAQTFESSVPIPRVEQPSEYHQFRQPSLPSAPVVPPARLQINRLDIQVVNQVQAPPPLPAQVPEVSQLLEKHLGRIELLL